MGIFFLLMLSPIWVFVLVGFILGLYLFLASIIQWNKSLRVRILQGVFGVIQMVWIFLYLTLMIWMIS